MSELSDFLAYLYQADLEVVRLLVAEARRIQMEREMALLESRINREANDVRERAR